MSSLSYLHVVRSTFAGSFCLSGLSAVSSLTRVRCTSASGGWACGGRLGACLGNATCSRGTHVGHGMFRSSEGPLWRVAVRASVRLSGWVWVGWGRDGLACARQASAVGECGGGTKPSAGVRGGSGGDRGVVGGCGGSGAAVCVGQLIVCELLGWGWGGLACACWSASAPREVGGNLETAAGVRGGAGGGRRGRRLQRLRCGSVCGKAGCG